MATFNIWELSRTICRRPSLVAVTMVGPMSLLFLQFWDTTSSITPQRLRGPGMATLVTLAGFLATWLLMTAAMMLPSAMPLLLSLDRIARNQPVRNQIPIIAAIAYLGVWGVIGTASWIANAAFQLYILPHTSVRVVSVLTGGCVALAGLYGLSPLANACLRACRRPFGFLARYWRGGSGVRLQAARIGAAYGASCVGCCVPMLAIMFVVGMSNLAVMIAMAALMMVMKSTNPGPRVAMVLAVVLIGAGFAIAMTWVPLSPHRH